MATYTFASIVGGSTKFKVGAANDATLPWYILKPTDRVEQTRDKSGNLTIISLIGYFGRYNIYLPSDTVKVGSSTYSPGANIDTVFDALNILFPKANSSSGGSGSDASQLTTGIIPDARLSSNVTLNASLATVAKTGAYSDLIGKPTIPTVTGTNTGDQDLSSYATKAGTETLTNKTISGSNNTFNNIPASAILASDTQVLDLTTYSQKTAAETLQNKTLQLSVAEAPAIGASTMIDSAVAWKIKPLNNRSNTIGDYLALIGIPHLYNHNGASTFNTKNHVVFGSKLASTSGAELASFVIGITKTTGDSDIPTEVVEFHPTNGITFRDAVTARINPRIQTITSSSTVTPNADTNDAIKVTAQASALTIANPSGTPFGMQSLVIRIKDNGTARAISFGTQYRAIGITLPTTTVISKTMYLGLIYNSDDTKWDIIGLSQEA